MIPLRVLIGLYGSLAGMITGKENGKENVGSSTYDNRQTIEEKICKKCGKPFYTKRLGGYENCRMCNGVEKKEEEK